MAYFTENDLRAAYFAGGYEGVTHAGLCIVAYDTGNVLLAQRSFDPTDDPAVQETWEFPGGSMNPGEAPLAAAVREFTEEVGCPLPEGKVVNGWRSTSGVYQGFIYVVPAEFDLTACGNTDEVQAVAWVSPEVAPKMDNLRPEMAEFDWTLVDDAPLGVSGNKEIDMTEAAPETPDLTGVESMVEEPPVLDLADILPPSIPVHGVVAPEGVESGDARAFNPGSMTARPLRLPFSWQKFSEEGHNRSVVIGSVDRAMRGPDGMIHWEGRLMLSEEACEFIELLAFFGKFGVSVDGDRGSVDSPKTQATEVLWFDAVRMAGLTAVAIPAFAEAYVAFGPHPDMPPAASDGEAAMVASGQMVGTGVSFARGPGWVTNPEDTKRIHDYWMPGHPGGAKIAWGTDGDFTRCVRLVGEKVATNSPEKSRFMNQICAQWHHDALGYWPGDLGKPGNAPDTPENRRRAAEHAHSAETLEAALTDLEFKDYTAKERENAHTLPDGSFPIENCDDLKNAVRAIGRAKDPAKAKAHIRAQKSRLGCPDVTLPWSSVTVDAATEGGYIDIAEQLFDAAYAEDRIHEIGEREDGAIIYELDPFNDDIAVDVSGNGWEAVLTSSAGTRALPPSSYFTRHPDTGALVIEEPDAQGFRRTYGYVGEWGVCHIGKRGQCVEVPEDPTGDFTDFHLGRTKTDDGYLNTGVLTYKVDHRDADTILSQTAEQQHFDNIKHAWASVRLGQDDMGIWFSGVVLPHVPEEDVTLIEATGQVSGEWLWGSLRACQAVNVPGYPVHRASAVEDDEGNVIALVASAHGTSECEPTPAEQMAALARIEAEARFEKLKEEWK